jgi:alkylhydroperoxidase family enzyme
MAHIDLPTNSPGIRGLFEFRPETAAPLGQLAEVLLRGDNTLERGERELIAAYVSSLNDCHFCMSSHAAFAALQLPDGWEVVDGVLHDPASAQVSDKMRGLLAIAGEVQWSGRAVTPETIAAARCMFNRYVDGLGTFAPPDRADYVPMAEQVVANGYVRPR